MTEDIASAERNPMTVTTTTADGGDDSLRAVVTNYGTLSGKSEGIPAEHQPYAERILKMDPLADVQGNVKDAGGYRPISLKASGLPDNMRSEVLRKLERLPNMSKDERAKYESRFVAEAVKSRQGGLRSLTGVSPDALPFHKEQADIAMQVRDLYRKRDDYQRQIDRVADVKKSEDPNTGEVIAEPVYWLSETKRSNFQNAIADIDRQVRLLVAPDGSFGVEGRRRMDKALAASAAILHRAANQKADEAEAQQRANEKLREERIERRAEVLARMKRSDSQ